MFIQTDVTPNTNVLKFSFNFIINATGENYSYLKKDNNENNSVAEEQYPLVVEEIFAIPGVRSIFISDKFFSIGKDDSAEWINLKIRIISVMMDHIEENKPLFSEKEELKTESESSKSETDYDPNDPVVKQIIDLIDERVRPFVTMDGGDIFFKSFNNGIVYVTLKGACSGCPSSTITLKNGVENMLKHYVPGVVEVRSVEQ